jgi:hypothetical protein
VCAPDNIRLHWQELQRLIAGEQHIAVQRVWTGAACAHHLVRNSSFPLVYMGFMLSAEPRSFERWPEMRTPANPGKARPNKGLGPRF